MEPEFKQAFGLVLGEIYRLQEHLGVRSSNNEAIYGLTHGIESMIDIALQKGGALISTKSRERVMRLLHDYEKNPERPLNGYLDLEPQLNALGIERGAAIRILKHLRSMGLYTETIDRLNTECSPPECRFFELTEADCQPDWQ